MSTQQKSAQQTTGQIAPAGEQKISREQTETRAPITLDPARVHIAAALAQGEVYRTGLANATRNPTFTVSVLRLTDQLMEALGK